MNDRPTVRDSLWMLTVSPAIWAIHFLLSYVTAAVWCQKYVGEDGSLGAARIAIAAYTVIAIVALALVGFVGYRRHAHGSASLPHDDDSPEDRGRFIGFSTFLLSALSAIAALFVAAVAVFIGTCD